MATNKNLRPTALAKQFRDEMAVLLDPARDNHKAGLRQRGNAMAKHMIGAMQFGLGPGPKRVHTLPDDYDSDHSARDKPSMRLGDPKQPKLLGYR